MEIESKKQQILERRKEIIIKLKMKISNTFKLIIAIVVSGACRYHRLGIYDSVNRWLVRRDCEAFP